MMNPYQPAIDALLAEANDADIAAAALEASGEADRAALNRVMAASCRAAITRLGGTPNAGKAYTWTDVASYSDSLDRVAGLRSFFLTMRDGSFRRIDIVHTDDEEEAQRLVMEELNKVAA